MSDLDSKKNKFYNDIYKRKQISFQMENQIKSIYDSKTDNRRRSHHAIDITSNKKVNITSNKFDLSIPKMRIETNIDNILHGKPLKQNSQLQSPSQTCKDQNLSLEETYIFSATDCKSSNKNASMNNTSTPTANQKEGSNNNNNTNSNILMNESQYTGNSKLMYLCKNFNTISNIETDEFYCSKNKYGNSLKIFGNINTTNTIHTYNKTNSNMNNILNSNNLDINEINSSEINEKIKIRCNNFNKTKSITDNKTDYKTLTSNNGTSKQNTLNSLPDIKLSKFQDKLLSHFKSIKSQKNTRAITPIYKENKVGNNISKNNSKKINSTIKNFYPNTENVNNLYVLNNLINKKKISNKSINLNKSSEYNNNKSNDKSIKNPYVNLKLNLEPGSNLKSNFFFNNSKTKSNKNSNTIDLRIYNTNHDNDKKLKVLLSEQFKFSMENSQRNNKSIQSNFTKNNRLGPKRSEISFDLEKQNENGRSLSIGERLYHKSVAIMNIKEKRASIELYKKDIETFNKYSFKPKICEDSIMLNIKSRYANINDTRNTEYDLKDIIDFSNSYIVLRNSKLIESHKLKREYEDLKEIKPTIKRPECVIKQYVEKLHNEKVILQTEREKLADLYFSEIYPFKPTINSTSEPRIESFFDRLQCWVEKRNESYKNDKIKSFFDKKTGKKFFKPSISIPSTIDSKSHRNEIDLYCFLHEEKKAKAERLIESEEAGLKRILENGQIKLSNEKTDEINKLLKEDCWAKLFEILDHNNDGVVECNDSSTKNVLENIDKDILDLLKPIFDELGEHEESLIREEFYLALDELFKILSVEQRRNVLNWYIEKKRVDSISRRRIIVDASNFTFKPFISERSNRYFSLSNRHEGDFIDRNHDLLTSRKLHFTEKSKEKMVKEMEGCTFKPEVNKNSERIDKRNKSAFIFNLSNMDLDFLLKPKATYTKTKLSGV